MALTKNEMYYNKITEELNKIKQKYGYDNMSLAFAHWYLKYYFHMEDQKIGECIIDGNGDMGIDAIDIDDLGDDEHSLKIFQFKFPSKKENIRKEIEYKEANATWDGFTKLIDNNYRYNKSNDKFKEIKDNLADLFISKTTIYYVSFNKGIIDYRDELEQKVEKFKSDSGNELEVVYHNVDIITNIYERMNRKNNVKITVKYKQLQAAYDINERDITSYVGFANGKELVNAIKDNIATIFDENIRLYEKNTKVNGMINRTASSTDQADMFYFYNNGIVFICDKVLNSAVSNSIKIEGVSVVNGCQTLNVLYDLYTKDRLSSDVCVLMRIIQIKDYNERMKITEYLNSQTPIKDSYFISNHISVRSLQHEMEKRGVFLERQINEYEYKKLRNEVVNYANVVRLDKAIQCYVGYWMDDYAASAKSGKGSLFDKNKIDTILSDINADKVLIAIETYDKISEIITLYRKMRRNLSKNEFEEFLMSDDRESAFCIDDYKYLNTADILLLNTVANLRQRRDKLNLTEACFDDTVKLAIFLAREVIKEASEKQPNTATLTRTNSVFQKVRDKINKFRIEDFVKRVPSS